MKKPCLTARLGFKRFAFLLISKIMILKKGNSEIKYSKNKIYIITGMPKIRKKFWKFKDSNFFEKVKKNLHILPRKLKTKP